MSEKYHLKLDIKLYEVSKKVAMAGIIIGTVVQTGAWLSGNNEIADLMGIGRYMAIPSATYMLGTAFAEAKFKPDKKSESSSKLEKEVTTEKR